MNKVKFDIDRMRLIDPSKVAGIYEGGVMLYKDLINFYHIEWKANVPGFKRVNAVVYANGIELQCIIRKWWLWEKVVCERRFERTVGGDVRVYYVGEDYIVDKNTWNY